MCLLKSCICTVSINCFILTRKRITKYLYIIYFRHQVFKNCSIITSYSSLLHHGTINLLSSSKQVNRCIKIFVRKRHYICFGFFSAAMLQDIISKISIICRNIQEELKRILRTSSIQFKNYSHLSNSALYANIPYVTC